MPGIGLAAWLGWTGWPVNAQDSGFAANTMRSYFNKTTINLPIVVDERHRAQLQQVVLFVKEGPTQPWRMCDKAPPTQTMFTYRAPGEGEYWFNIVSVDHAGRMTPPDVTREAPALIVVLDTQAPRVDVQPLEKTGDGQFVRCDWHDVHLDAFKSRLYYQTGDMAWRQLDAHATRANTFCIPAQANWTGNVRAVGMDLAGNTTTRERNLMLAAAAPAPQGLPGQNTSAPSVAGPIAQAPAAPAAPIIPSSYVVVPNTVLPNTNVLLNAGAPGTPPSPTAIQPATRITATQEPPLPIMPPAKDNTAPANPPVLANPPPPVATSVPPRVTPQPLVSSEITNPRIAPVAPQLFDPAVAGKSTPLAPSHDLRQASFRGRDPMTMHRTFSNTNRVVLDYRIEAMGASGVGKVDVWYTRDLGQSWQKLCEDTDRQSPAEINLPGDGIYGISLVICNGRGFGGVPPSPGDAPDSWLEVDTTKPVGEIVQVRAGMGEDSGALHITWNARDKNLGNDSIELQYAASREGPWQQVAKGLKNEGVYRWLPPAEAGAQVFLRLTVRDQANNVAFADTPQAVLLDDASRPRGRVVSISTAAPRANPLADMP